MHPHEDQESSCGMAFTSLHTDLGGKGMDGVWASSAVAYCCCSVLCFYGGYRFFICLLRGVLCA